MRILSLMPIYLDYNATAPLRKEVAKAMFDQCELIGNPSSIHGFGRHARRTIETAREQVAQLIDANPIDVVFTSGATEANNAVIFGAPVERILVSAIEHPSVLDAAVAGKKAEIIPVLANGLIDLATLEKQLAESNMPTLISVMWVNNETGVIQPVEDIGHLAKKYGALFHCDAVQAAGKLAIDLDKHQIDYLTLSAHKIGGPAGIGALVYSHHTKLGLHLWGGGQERRRRAGTENTLGIVGFGAACACAKNELTLSGEKSRWRDALEMQLKQHIPRILFAGEDAPRVGNTSQMLLPGAPAETQLMALDLAGFAVSSGSACSSGSIKPSHVLLAMGFSPAEARCAIRFSMGFQTTQNDVNAFLKQYVANAQRFINN